MTFKVATIETGVTLPEKKNLSPIPEIQQSEKTNSPTNQKE